MCETGKETPTVTKHSETANQADATGDLIDRAILDQMIEDVGAENAEPLIEAFIEELAGQVRVLGEAADRADLAAMERAAHSMKGSAATFGATRLTGVVTSIEQAARSGQGDLATAAMGECHWLAQASMDAMRVILIEVSGPAT